LTGAGLGTAEHLSPRGFGTFQGGKKQNHMWKLSEEVGKGGDRAKESDGGIVHLLGGKGGQTEVGLANPNGIPGRRQEKEGKKDSRRAADGGPVNKQLS